MLQKTGYLNLSVFSCVCYTQGHTFGESVLFHILEAAAELDELGYRGLELLGNNSSASVSLLALGVLELQMSAAQHFLLGSPCLYPPVPVPLPDVQLPKFNIIIACDTSSLYILK